LALCAAALPAAAQQGATVNPTPGSVWTYLGPTFGADWAPPSTANLITPPAYGAKGDGTTDDTAGVQACLNAASDGGTCLITNKGRYKLSGGITIPRATTLDCGWRSTADYSPPMLPASNWGPALLLDPTHPIGFADTSGRIQNCTIVPIGMVFPQTSSTAWTGTAINTSARANPQIVDSTIVGFDTCINTTGSQRPYLVHLHLDCTGVTSASLVTGDNGDIATLTDIKLQVLGTNTVCPDRNRAGSGLRLVGYAWVDNLIAMDFAVAAIHVDTAAQIFFGKVWIDHGIDGVGGCTRGTSAGLYVSGVEDLDFQHLDIQGVQNGIQIVAQNDNQSIHIGDLWLNAIGNDGVQMGLPSGTNSGGVLQIDMIRTNKGAQAIGGYAVNIIDATHSSYLKIGGGTIRGAHGGVAPYINVGGTTAAHVQVSDSIVTDLANPSWLWGAANLIACTGVDTGGCQFYTSLRTTPWSGTIVLNPTGAPAGAGEALITWAVPFNNTSGCTATYKAGSTGWPGTLVPISVVDQTTSQTKFVWNTTVPLTAGQSYQIVFDCKPQ
jgi:hypothetical protein